ncbi:hypothetical protein [Nitrospirillum viridazoti]|uniref:Uncharacterized protein n=1 Tax=Nitrospirillum viridazoti CBAmc TaxID=1441467 RepID=A0A248JP71_9PROT|nr:hypothetical protein [Nitrospirillum amazonense]ASG20495.1 hypothetical protein Y958_06465 [Nitrospirillum amazonense CBAmc]TWB34905.1 hypothetical protein FBZ91_111237 [Nitrospirillum amazonense]
MISAYLLVVGLLVLAVSGLTLWWFSTDAEGGRKGIVRMGERDKFHARPFFLAIFITGYLLEPVAKMRNSL